MGATSATLDFGAFLWDLIRRGHGHITHRKTARRIPRAECRSALSTREVVSTSERTWFPRPTFKRPIPRLAASPATASSVLYSTSFLSRSYSSSLPEAIAAHPSPSAAPCSTVGLRVFPSASRRYFTIAPPSVHPLLTWIIPSAYSAPPSWNGWLLTPAPPSCGRYGLSSVSESSRWPVRRPQCGHASKRDGRSVGAVLGAVLLGTGWTAGGRKRRCVRVSASCGVARNNALGLTSCVSSHARALVNDAEAADRRELRPVGRLGEPLEVVAQKGVLARRNKKRLQSKRELWAPSRRAGPALSFGRDLVRGGTQLHTTHPKLSISVRDPVPL